MPGIALAISTVMSIFGLRRDLRGALVGHLAAYEMTSSEPCRRYAKGLRRLGADAAWRFYDEHELTEDVVFGAAVSLHVDTRFAEHVLGAWEAGRSSLYRSAPALAAAG